jgi:hypothetical protein
MPVLAGSALALVCRWYGMAFDESSMGLQSEGSISIDKMGSI